MMDFELSHNHKSDILKPFFLLYHFRKILYHTTLADIKGRFIGSILGPVWLILYPLLFLGAYALVYLYIFQIRLPDMSAAEYVAVIFCGLVPFLAFAEALGLGVFSVVSNSHLVKNTLFPIELIPVKASLIPQTSQLMGMVLLLLGVSVLGKITPFVLIGLAIWVFQILFTIGIVWIISSLAVFVRDLNQIVSVGTLILMLVSPIAYTIDMVPEGLVTILQFNPLYYLIIPYQDAFVFGKMPDILLLSIFISLSLITFIGGYALFIRLKGVFADNV